MNFSIFPTIMKARSNSLRTFSNSNHSSLMFFCSSFFPALFKSENDTSCLVGAYRTLETNTISRHAYEPIKLKPQQDVCGERRGIIAWSDGSCKQLYSQGPCNPGEWVVPDRSKGQRKGRGWKMGKCECRPGYTQYEDETSGTTVCQPPTVVLARFLNNRTEKQISTGAKYHDETAETTATSTSTSIETS